MTSLSISNNRNEILTAYKKVINGPVDTWCLFSYESSNKSDLKVESQGTDGLEELEQEFSSVEIQYALCKVQCPKTGLEKVVLVNWQGEAVSGIFRGRAANHVNDVYRHFNGIHITIHARNEDDVDPELIMAEVSRNAASSYNFKEQPGRSEIEPPEQNIGTNYERIKNPGATIAPSHEREKFWAKQHADDQERRKREEEEAKKLIKEHQEELRKKDIESAKARAKLVKAKALELSKMERPQDIAENTGPVYKGVPNGVPSSNNKSSIGANSQGISTEKSPSSMTSSVASNSSSNMFQAKANIRVGSPSAGGGSAYKNLGYNPNQGSAEKGSKQNAAASYVKNLASNLSATESR